MQRAAPYHEYIAESIRKTVVIWTAAARLAEDTIHPAPTIRRICIDSELALAEIGWYCGGQGTDASVGDTGKLVHRDATGHVMWGAVWNQAGTLAGGSCGSNPDYSSWNDPCAIHM